MKTRVFIFILTTLLLPSFLKGQTVNIGDILCTDGSTIRPNDFASSGRTAEGIVFYVNESGQGWAVSLDCQAVNTNWVTSEHYYDMYDIPGLDNLEHSREALYDLDGYSNTSIIRDAHGADWYPAAWSMDFDNGWYLPAAGQMRWMIAYINEINASLAIVNGTMFVFDHPRWYWTSTERTEAHALVISQTGAVGNYPKYNYIGEYEIGVRAVKSFTVQAQTPTIGEVVTTSGGQQGIVFYVSPDDDSYWLVALNDLQTRYPWGMENDIPALENYNNTDQFVVLHGVHCGNDATAAMRQSQQSDPQFATSHVDADNGWHIPSIGQLSKLYAALPFIEQPLAANGGSTLTGDYYWSSNECSAEQAWAINFGVNLYTEGLLAPQDKLASHSVRPVWSLSCETPPPPEPTLPDNILDSDCNTPLEGFEWGIREDWSSGDNIYCRIMPLVGDLDDDGIPEIVCFDMLGNSASQTAAKTINVYDGRDKHLKVQINVEGMVWAHGSGPYGLVKLPNREGLIVTACKDSKLYAYNTSLANSSVPVWVSNASYNTGNNDFSVSLGFADFNGDGFPEIYVRDKIFDAETGTLLAVAQGGNNQADSYSHGSHTNHNKVSCPIAFDICGDARQELILGNEIYDVVITNRNGTAGNHVTLTKSITPPENVIADGNVQVADFNLDGHPDILVSNRDTEGASGTVSFYVWDVFNNTTSNAIKLNTSFIGKSVPLIADFDNDGTTEILIDCCHEENQGLRAYRFNPTANSFNYLWSLHIDEDSYSNSATLFDFNGNGRNELVFTDNSDLWVYDLGTTPPTLLSQIDCGEITIMHVPIVADVDADGSAEIVVTGKEGGYMQANTKLKVFKSSTEPWRAARKVWNQYMYHVTNVNEDLTIPTYCFNTATTFTADDGNLRRPYNNFLQQAGYITPQGEPYNPNGLVEIDTVGSGCETFTFLDTVYTESGLYDQLVESASGCDTLYHIDVTLGQTVTYDFWRVHCYSYTWNGEEYTESGLYQQTFVAPGGCDSIVTLHLQIRDTITYEWSAQACQSFTWNGITYTEPGDHVQEFVAAHDCDSIVTLHLSIGQTLEYEADSTVCGSLVWNGQEYTSSGEYDQQFVDVDGCDSIVHLHLTVNDYPAAIPEIEGLTAVHVATDMILGQYFYSIDSVPLATHYEWLLDGADWPMDTTGTQCSLWITSAGIATLTVRAWNDCGYSEQSIVIHAGFYDLDDNATIPILLYPNPSNKKAIIESQGIQCVKVYDLQGQLIKEWSGAASDKIELELGQLSSALYVVEVATHLGKAFLKMSVKH